MSVEIRSYKLVSRDYLRKLVNQQMTIVNAIFANAVAILSLQKKNCIQIVLKHIIKLLTGGELNIRKHNCYT